MGSYLYFAIIFDDKGPLLFLLKVLSLNGGIYCRQDLDKAFSKENYFLNLSVTPTFRSGIYIFLFVFNLIKFTY